MSIDQLTERVFYWADRYVLGSFISDSYTELSDWEIELRDLVGKYLPKWKEDVKYFTKALALESERITTLSEIPTALNFFYDDTLTWTDEDWNTGNHSKRELAEALENVLPKLDEIFRDNVFNHDKWEEVVRGYADQLGWKHGDLFLAIRSATTGRLKSPPLLECYEVMGWGKVKSFINQAVIWLRK